MEKENSFITGSMMISASLLIFAGVQVYLAKRPTVSAPTQSSPTADTAALQKAVAPSNGVVLPVKWGDLGKRMVVAGVIDAAKFEALYAGRGELAADAKMLLDSDNNGQLVITPENSGTLLNLLWALGLANKNPVLEKGPMRDPAYGGAGQFASTGGWTLARGDTMTHYSAHELMSLTTDQQSLVERVAKDIYRPCCGNDTYFPDCNHGMAMFGLLELMASQGASEDQMYKAALAVNSYWFSGEYLVIAKYLAGKGIAWNSVNPKDILAANFSSAQGYRQILAQSEPTQDKSSGGCGV